MAGYLRFAIDGGRKADMAAAVRDLDRCVRMNPGDFESAATLAEWMDRWGVGERARLIEVHRAMRHFFPEFHDRRFVQGVGGRVHMCDYAEAARRANLLVEIDGGDPKLLNFARTAAFFAGDLEAVRALSARLSELGDPSPAPWRALAIAAETAQGGYPRDRADARLQEAAALVESMPTPDEAAVRNQRALAELIALRRATIADDIVETEASLQRMSDALKRDPELLAQTAANYQAAFRDPATARRILDLRFKAGGTPLPGTWALLAHLALEPWMPKIEALSLAQQAAAKEGRAPERVQDELLRDALREAAVALRNSRASMIPEDTVSREIVDARLRRIESLLGPDEAPAQAP